MAQSEYVFTDRAAEQRRLERQAEAFEPLTLRVFQEAGLAPGMRVLDLGSGAGDVAMLAARLVGSSGEVVGVERDPAAVSDAAARVARAGLPNVRFVQGDVQILEGIEAGFDAVVGRLVLMYLPEPAAALARAARLVRPGGVVCVQEIDLSYDWAAPMTPLWTEMRALFIETLRRARVAPRMGLSLWPTFVAAGLPPPELRLECIVGGGSEAKPWGWANMLVGALPLMERLGVTTAATLQPETLVQRLLDDVLAAKGIVIGPPFVGAWARMPA